MTATITGRHIYGFGAIAAAQDPDDLESGRLDDTTREALAGLLPDLDRRGVKWLWEEARIDAAALHQLDQGDPHLWPLSDMDPPRRTSDRFDTFLVELERTVDARIAEARTKRCPVCHGAGGWQQHDGARRIACARANRDRADGGTP